MRRTKTAVAAILVTVAALVGGVTSSTSAHQGLVHAQVLRDGTIAVHGYDGGASLTAVPHQ